MDEAELNAIRQARLAELQKNSGNGGSSRNSGFPGANSGGQGSQNASASAADEMRLGQLAQVLTLEARERLSRIRMVRSDRARNVEDLILNLAKSGRLQQKVTEEHLKQLLEQLSEQENKANRTKIVVSNALYLCFQYRFVSEKHGYKPRFRRKYINLYYFLF